MNFRIRPRAGWGSWVWLVLPAVGLEASAQVAAPKNEFRQKVQPILEKYCYDCHADGANKGGVAFDKYNPNQPPGEARALWWRALKNVRAGLMPPPKKLQLSAEAQADLEQWIKGSVFKSDPRHPDPGRVTLRRLNRVEYRNTIHDLLGVDYDTQAEFPADDTGFGFDNIGEVLTLPPMLLEKYVIAANSVVGEAVPTESRIMPKKVLSGHQFRFGQDSDAGPLSLCYYEPALVTNIFNLEHAGEYEITMELTVNDHYVDNVFDYSKCRAIFRADQQELWRQDFGWEQDKSHHVTFHQHWAVGPHLLTLELQPLNPGEKPARKLSLQLHSITVNGPLNPNYWVKPKNYDRFFPQTPPVTEPARRDYARKLIGNFARRAFRRPVGGETIDRLVALAQQVYLQPGKSFEAGVAQAMVAVLASPRFLFHMEGGMRVLSNEPFPLVDDYTLASRLSYFLWSSMPDEDLLRLAGTGRLRENLDLQFQRLLASPRAQAFIKNFSGQWLQARDIETVPIEVREVLAREKLAPTPETQAQTQRLHLLSQKAAGVLTSEEKTELAHLRATLALNAPPSESVELTEDLRRAMRQETERTLDYVLRENRSLLELLDADYAFLNESLAKQYGITNVLGRNLRRVSLPPSSPRGGILTQATVLIVTSNPTRTSPVKRGGFILENILGAPSPPPPPNVPPLEAAALAHPDHPPSLRDTLGRHRADPLCSSCHNRLDPLGLALENFNALGAWRDQELNQPIDASGTLFSGESFANIRELKHILARNHGRQFYRTLAEKLLIYALGRGLDYYDVETVDQLVERLEKADGRSSALLLGVVESAPFQRRRPDPVTEGASLPPRHGPQAQARQTYEN